MKDVLLSSIALRQYQELDNATKKRIKDALQSYARDGRGDIKQLKGTRGRESLYRLRVGVYRIIFAQRENTIFVTQLIHRSKGYDWL